MSALVQFPNAYKTRHSFLLVLTPHSPKHFIIFSCLQIRVWIWIVASFWLDADACFWNSLLLFSSSSRLSLPPAYWCLQIGNPPKNRNKSVISTHNKHFVPDGLRHQQHDLHHKLSKLLPFYLIQPRWCPPDHVTLTHHQFWSIRQYIFHQFWLTPTSYGQ